jgi:hypothetical protein
MQRWVVVVRMVGGDVGLLMLALLMLVLYVPL